MNLFFATSKVTKEAEILQEGFSLILCGEKNFYRTAIYSKGLRAGFFYRFEVYRTAIIDFLLYHCHLFVGVIINVSPPNEAKLRIYRHRKMRH